MSERSRESRRQFLSKAPTRLVCLYGLAATGSAILAGCTSRSTESRPAGVEPQTPAESEISHTIQLYDSARQRPGVPNTAAVTLAQAELQGQNPQNILALYYQIKEHYRSIFADYGLIANLAYAAGKYGHSEKTARGLFEASKKAGFTFEIESPSDLATLAMARGGDVGRPQETFRQIANDDSLKFLGLTTSFDSVSTLTSAALLSDKDKTLDIFRRIKRTQSFGFSYEAPAVLTLAATLASGDVDRVVNDYSTTNKHNFETTFGLRVITKNGIAVLTLAGIVGGGLNDSLEMYDFAIKTGSMDSYTACRLVLATAAKKANLPLTSRKNDRRMGTKPVIITYSIVPIALAR